MFSFNGYLALCKIHRAFKYLQVFFKKVVRINFIILNNYFVWRNVLFLEIF